MLSAELPVFSCEETYHISLPPVGVVRLEVRGQLKASTGSESPVPPIRGYRIIAAHGRCHMPLCYAPQVGVLDLRPPLLTRRAKSKSLFLHPRLEMRVVPSLPEPYPIYILTTIAPDDVKMDVEKFLDSCFVGVSSNRRRVYLSFAMFRLRMFKSVFAQNQSLILMPDGRRWLPGSPQAPPSLKSPEVRQPKGSSLDAVQ